MTEERGHGFTKTNLRLSVTEIKLCPKNDDHSTESQVMLKKVKRQICLGHVLI